MKRANHLILSLPTRIACRLPLPIHLMESVAISERGASEKVHVVGERKILGTKRHLLRQFHKPLCG